MADLGHQETEKILKELEQRIAGEYRTAVRDMQKKLRDYQEQTEAQRLVQKKLFSEGKITQKEYTDWCYRHMMMGKRWEQMLDVLTKDMHHANEIALKMAKEAMPDVYALNANYATYQIEHDARIDTGFVLYNHDTAEYLLGDERQLMPGPSTRKAREIAANKDMQWNKQKIQSAVFQGVVQGESPYDVAKRLMQVGQMNYNSAVRYARTMTTSAQNAGRYEAFRRADKLGVDLTIEWQATLDSRTRHEHRLMHGQRTTVDKPFHTPDGYTIMYPADCTGTSTAPQHEIWNCRCTLLSWVKGFEGETVKESPGMEGMSFEEWQGLRDIEDNQISTVVEGKDISTSWVRRPDKFDFEIEDVINAQGFDGLPKVVDPAEFDKYVEESKFVAQRVYSSGSKEVLEKYREELYYGKWYVDCSTGGSTFGQGMYCAGNFNGEMSPSMLSEMSSYSNLQRAKYEKPLDRIKINERRYSMAERAGNDIIDHGGSNDEAYSAFARIRDMDDLAFAQEYAKDLLPQTGFSYVETMTIDKSARIGNYDDIVTAYREAGSDFEDIGSFAAARGFDGYRIISWQEDSDVVLLNRTKVIIRRN